MLVRTSEHYMSLSTTSKFQVYKANGVNNTEKKMVVFA